MKNNLLLLFAALCFLFWNNAEAQIKVNNDNSVSIGSLTGHYGINVTSTGMVQLRS